MRYTLMLDRHDGTFHCCTRGGWLHMTRTDLAKEYPHLVRSWKHRSSAQACLRRVLAKYKGQWAYGNPSKYRIVEY